MIATKNADVKALILEKLEGRPDVILEATGTEEGVQTSLSIDKKGWENSACRFWQGQGDERAYR